mgnify:FL=1|jgi:hypothetical protein
MSPESRIYVPPEYLKEEKPLVFLAGPIQGAEDWQTKAIEIIHSQNPDIIIASPRISKIDDKFNKNEQIDWETYHLRKAGSNGVIMFWLAKEKEHISTRAYAQTSRFELSEWKLRHEIYRSKLIVGIEEGFSNTHYIKRRFSQDCPDVPIFDSLEATCERVVKELTK